MNQQPVVEVCRVALRAPRGQMQGATTTAMVPIEDVDAPHRTYRRPMPS